MNQTTAGCDKPQPKFSLGQIVATPNALTNILNDEILNALSRHAQGDWGTLDAEDLQSNERALRFGGRLFSQYHSTQNVRFWIITECDRSVTCCNLSSGKGAVTLPRQSVLLVHW